MSDKNIDWSSAPEWADRLITVGLGADAWANDHQYQYLGGPPMYQFYVIGRIGDHSKKQCELIEMRPIDIEDKEWLPVVGEECLVEYPYEDGCFKPFHAKKVTIIGKCKDDDGSDVFTAHGPNGFIALTTLGFRPLKTAEELKEEAFKAAVSDAIYKSTSTHYDRLEKISSVLFKAGFEPPSGDE